MLYKLFIAQFAKNFATDKSTPIDLRYSGAHINKTNVSCHRVNRHLSDVSKGDASLFYNCPARFWQCRVWRPTLLLSSVL